MYDTVAILRKNGGVEYDDYGNEVINYEDREVYATTRSVYASEFYQASQLGLKPTITFEISTRSDYQGERLVIWDNREFNVIRVDADGQRDYVRLICEERINVK